MFETQACILKQMMLIHKHLILDQLSLIFQLDNLSKIWIKNKFSTL